MYTNFWLGSLIHCNPKDLDLYASEYDKCETNSTLNLEYYQCVYKIYHIPTEQVDLFSKLHITILKCKDCEYTRNWKFKDPKFCTNKVEAEYYKTYSDCLLNYININEEELGKPDSCISGCHSIPEFNDFLKCAYGCYKDIAKKVVEFEPKVTTFVNNTQINANNTEESKKSSALPNFGSSIIFSVFTSILLVAF